MCPKNENISFSIYVLFFSNQTNSKILFFEKKNSSWIGCYRRFSKKITPLFNSPLLRYCNIAKFCKYDCKKNLRSSGVVLIFQDFIFIAPYQNPVFIALLCKQTLQKRGKMPYQASKVLAQEIRL